MSFVLGSLTLPPNIVFTRDNVETQRVNLLLNGTTRRNFINRKERFLLQFQHLTRSEVNQILAQYELNQVLDFTVTEDNLTIGPIRVHVDVEEREYVTKGPEFRENLKVILTEVI